MNCLIYSRVSTDEQAEKGRSMEDQIAICKKFIKDHDYRFQDVFEDPGKSATNMNRPGLQDMLLRCQEDKSINAVLVQDTDRLARNPGDHLQIKALLKKNDIQLISVSQPMLSGNDPESNFIDLIIAGVNAFQSQITGRKVSKTMNQKVLEGWWPGWAPLGYKNQMVDGKNIIVIDEDKAYYIKRMFELYATGTKSMEEIVNELKKTGLKTRLDRPISKSQVAFMLKNPFYIGKILYKGVIYAGNHQLIIDSDVFYACQQNMAIRNHFATRTRKHFYLLRGVLFCAQCGSRVFADKHTKSDGRVYDYYFCPNCKPCVAVAKIEKEVQEAFKYLKFSETFIKKILASAEKILQQTRSNIGQERQIIATQISQSEIKRDRLEDKLLEETIDRDTYKRQHQKLDQEIVNLNDAIAKLEDDRSENLKIFEELIFMSRNIYKTYAEAEPALKKHYLALFWEKFEMADGKIKKVVPTKTFKVLLSQNSIEMNSKVRKSLLWLPGLDSNQQPFR